MIIEGAPKCITHKPADNRVYSFSSLEDGSRRLCCKCRRPSSRTYTSCDDGEQIVTLFLNIEVDSLQIAMFESILRILWEVYVLRDEADDWSVSISSSDSSDLDEERESDDEEELFFYFFNNRDNKEKISVSFRGNCFPTLSLATTSLTDDSSGDAEDIFDTSSFQPQPSCAIYAATERSEQKKRMPRFADTTTKGLSSSLKHRCLLAHSPTTNSGHDRSSAPVLHKKTVTWAMPLVHHCSH